MSGDHEKLRQALDDLQAQLAEMRQVDPEVAVNLDTTIARAKSVLGPAATDSAEHHTVSEQFGEALVSYESSHPTLAGTIRSVIDALGQIGI